MGIVVELIGLIFFVIFVIYTILAAVIDYLWMALNSVAPSFATVVWAVSLYLISYFIGRAIINVLRGTHKRRTAQ